MAFPTEKAVLFYCIRHLKRLPREIPDLTLEDVAALVLYEEEIGPDTP